MNIGQKAISLSLVIPCYNESDRVGLLYNGVAEFTDKWPGPFEIIIVNDGSKDDTVERLTTHNYYLSNKDRVSIINQQNTGKGGALKHGVENASGDFILTLDADMAAQPIEVIKWMGLLNWEPDHNTIYIASREHRNSIIINEAIKRKVAGNIFNLIVRIFTPLRVKDSQCGFKLYAAGIAKSLFSKLQTYGWGHDVEILCRAHYKNISIKEMAIEWQAIEGSKINLVRDSVAMLREILNVHQKLKRD